MPLMPLAAWQQRGPALIETAWNTLTMRTRSSGRVARRGSAAGLSLRPNIPLTASNMPSPREFLLLARDVQRKPGRRQTQPVAGALAEHPVLHGNWRSFEPHEA